MVPGVIPRAAPLACLLALVVCGCGTGGREDDAATVSARFHAAVDARDGAGACAQLNPETASKLEQQQQKPCEEAILSLELPAGHTVSDVSVYVTSAFTTLAEGGSDFLDEGPTGWRVSAAGCEATAPSQPYDCELEN